MVLIIYVINTIIRLICGWCMFYSFNSEYYLLASFFLMGVLKRNWLVYNPLGYGGHIQIGIDIDNNNKKK